MMAAWTGADGVLPDPAPDVGDAAAVDALGGRLAETDAALHGLVARAEGLAGTLAGQESLTTARIVRAVRRSDVFATEVARTAGHGGAVLRDHAREARDLADRASAIRSTVDDTMGTIAAIRSALTGLGVAGLGPWTWRPPGSARGRLGDHELGLQLSAGADAVNATRAAERSALLTRWRQAEQTVDAALARWVELQAARGELDARTASRLGEPALVARLGGLDAATGTAAATAIGGWAHATGAVLAELERLDGDPEQVAALWARTDAATRERLVTEASLVIGNLAGIPLAVRIRANRLTAERELGRLERRLRATVEPSTRAGLLTRIAFLRSVVAGDAVDDDRPPVHLVGYSPAEDRIITLHGSLAGLERVLIVVPGTGTELTHLVDGQATALAESVRRTSPGTAVLVHRDGPWVTWTGDGANTDVTRLRELGDDLARLRRALATELPEDVPVGAVGHSAGMSVVSGAELAGARFDTVHSLAGSFLLPGWRPVKGTEYVHYQYGFDGINALELPRTLQGAGIATPFATPPFERRVFDPAEEPQHEDDPVANHIRVFDGEERNPRVIDGIRRDIEE
jgi:hypothetical protein